jgi:polysaccharide chain length determinant protein (PEP-CTERM system associated)
MDDSIKVLTYALNSRTLVLKVINALDLNVKAMSDAETEDLIKAFQKNTEIKVKDKDLFIISFKHSNPRIARDYVNTLVRSYIEENVSSKREESYGATKFLSEQITTYKQKLEKAEAAVVDFKRQKGGVINLDEGRLLQEINTAQQKLYDLQLRRRLLEGQLRATQKTPDPLLANLQTLKKRLDELRVEYTDNYPEVIKVRTDIESLQEQINARKGANFSSPDPQDVQKTEAELSAIKSSEISLQRYIAANQSLLNNAPTAKAALEKLEAEKNNQKNMYDQLFARHDQSEVSKQMELQDKSATFRIVDPAVMPAKPISPDRIRIILMGMVAGLASGVGLLLLLDLLDQSVKEVSTLKALGVPVLAVIPMMKTDDDVQVERRRDLRLYVMSGLYFSLILAVLVLETLTRFFPKLATKLPSWL